MKADLAAINEFRCFCNGFPLRKRKFSCSFISEVLLGEEVIIDLKLIVINEIERLFQGSVRVLVCRVRRNVENKENQSINSSS
jgi:hypothetical protein